MSLKVYKRIQKRSKNISKPEEFTKIWKQIERKREEKKKKNEQIGNIRMCTSKNLVFEL